MMLSSLLLFVIIISGILISCCIIVVNGSTTTTDSSSSSSRSGDDDDVEKCTGAENNDDGTSSCVWKKSSEADTNHHHDDNEDCTLVVAPSTIPNAGLGIFTLKELQPDQQVGESDLVIPMKELVLIKHNSQITKTHHNNKNTNTIIFEDYTWSGRIYSGENDAYAPGLQSLSNSHLGLFNIFPQPAKFHNKNIDGWISTNDDSTFYHGVTTFVGNDYPIPAGGELFAMYGDHWFEGRSSSLIKQQQQQQQHGSSSSNKDYTTSSSTTTTMMMASSDDYYIAEELVKMYQTKFGDDESSTYSYNNNNNNQYSLSYWPVDLWHVVEDFVRIWNGHAAANILPDYSQLRQTQQLGIRSIYQSMVTQDVEELKHAMTVVGTARCVDSIRPGPSKIHNQGGFSKRNYSKGSIITGSPLLHSDIRIWNPKRTAWDPTTETYITADETKNNKNNNNDDDDDDNHYYYTMYQNHALLINYCWSHINSSILLCPYAPGVSYINHASPRLINNNKEGKQQQPNVKIQWAPNGQLSHNDDAFQYSPDDLVNNFTNKVSLAIDYVALRDIAEGEELTIDYGMEWEKARHYFQQQNHNVATSEAILRRYNEQALLKTEVEQLSDPYPDDIVLKCMAHIMYSASLPTEGDDETMWQQVITQQQKQSSSLLLDCSVLERQQMKISDGSTRIVYAVRVFHEGSWKGRAGIPRRYIRWFFANGDNNNQHTKVFRFPMQLPDEMVPTAWKDIVR